MNQRKHVREAILNGSSSEAPSIHPLKFVDCLSRLDNPTFYIMSLVKYNSIPLVSIQPSFTDVAASWILMWNSTVGGDYHIVFLERLTIFFTLLRVVDQSLDTFGMALDLCLPLAQ